MNNETDEFLHAYREAPEPGFAVRLQGQLAELGPPAAASPLQRLLPRQGGAQRPGAWKLRLAALAAVLALLFTVTPLRALATDILYEWGLITFTNDPTVPDLMAAGVTPTPKADAGHDAVLSLDGEDVEEAAALSQQVGYPMYVPQYVPAKAKLFDRATSEITTGGYAVATGYMMGNDDLLWILQTRSNSTEREFAVGDAGVEAETVNANPAVWVEGISTFHKGTTVFRSNMLLWEADGYSFTIMSSSKSLDRATIKAIAESMVPSE